MSTVTKKKMMENLAAWVEIPASDFVRAKKFYQGIFDIQLMDINMGNGMKMAMFPVEEGGVGGAICQHEEFYHPGHEGTLVYYNANPDLQMILNKVIPNGGKVLQEKTQISEEYGYMALFEDSEGNRVALHSME